MIQKDYTKRIFKLMVTSSMLDRVVWLEGGLLLDPLVMPLPLGLPFGLPNGLPIALPIGLPVIGFPPARDILLVILDPDEPPCPSPGSVAALPCTGAARVLSSLLSSAIICRPPHPGSGNIKCALT